MTFSATPLAPSSRHPRRGITGKLAAAVVAAGIGTTLLQAPAEAAPPIRFTVIQYDSPGSDNGSNASLNAEWVRIKNHGANNRNIGRWTIRDTSGHVFRFPAGFVLRAGASVTVRTGSGSSTQTNRYWGQDNYVWNNDGDRATLKRANGTVVDRCSWGDGSGRKIC